MSIFSKGSEWRKWDLQVHVPGSKLYDDYKNNGKKDVLDEFCENIEQSDVVVFGMTDYFSANNFNVFIKKYKDKYPNSDKKFFLNIELRLNESVNKEQEEINIHLIFNPTSLNRVDKFLSKLKVVKTKEDETPIMCSELKSDDEYRSASITRVSITDAFEETFGKKAVRQEHFLIFTAANNDGIRPERGKQRKAAITDEIDKFSDAFFGGAQNVDYFLNIHRLEDEDQLINEKPVVSSSDTHSFKELYEFLGKRVTKEEGGKEVIVKDPTWIKSDPTFEGLKQIIYEPKQGERVSIGPIKPDQKDDYKIIKKMVFKNTNDFPEAIVFNKNLCSIIGSRSSGKSALLAYMAHAVDKKMAEKMVDGPGEGESYLWSKINLEYSIEWENGKSNTESPGKVVYIPQNYLFKKSKDPDEIKEKIEPVLFKVFPYFQTKYAQSIKDINMHNQEILGHVGRWFELSNSISELDNELKDLGNKKAVEKEKKEYEAKIEALKKKYKLSKEDVEKYQSVSADISVRRGRIKQIVTELSQISNVTKENVYFSSLKITFIPAFDNLPRMLQEEINKGLVGKKNNILIEVNKQIFDYKASIEKEKVRIEEEVGKIEEENSKLITKYKKNVELEEFIEKLNNHAQLIEKIKKTDKDKKEILDELARCEKAIKLEIDKRIALIEQLKIDKADQHILKDIKFGVEYDFDENLNTVTQKINMRDKTRFTEKNVLKIKEIREKPADFLLDVYTEQQKINVGNDKKQVAQEVLSLTEKILFTAEMEKDKIGGFSKSTMTPGKRSLFALKMILAESEDTWPLLIDQPEDDLDSRSIYDEIVPFLKEKKKERQIIMVSHNANLVVGADSEQIIVANRHYNSDGKQFNYLTGSIEYTKEKDKNCKDALQAQGIREHACEILDGGKIAFENRRNKYNLTKP